MQTDKTDVIAEADSLWDCVSSVINELDGLAKGQETDHRAGGYARVVQEKARKSIEFLERRFESRDSCLRALTSRGNELESIAFRSEDITGQLVRPRAKREHSSQPSEQGREGLEAGPPAWASCPQGAAAIEAQEGVPCPLGNSQHSGTWASRARAWMGGTLRCDPSDTHPVFLQGNNDDLILSCCLHYCKDKAKDFMPTNKGSALPPPGDLPFPPYLVLPASDLGPFPDSGLGSVKIRNEA